MELTPEDIELIETSEGKGFTWAKLNSWGVSTPPSKGWRSKLIKELGLKRRRIHPKAWEIPEIERLRNKMLASRQAYEDKCRELGIEPYESTPTNS